MSTITPPSARSLAQQFVTARNDFLHKIPQTPIAQNDIPPHINAAATLKRDLQTLITQVSALSLFSPRDEQSYITPRYTAKSSSARSQTLEALNLDLPIYANATTATPNYTSYITPRTSLESKALTAHTAKIITMLCKRTIAATDYVSYPLEQAQQFIQDHTPPTKPPITLPPGTKRLFTLASTGIPLKKGRSLIEHYDDNQSSINELTIDGKTYVLKHYYDTVTGIKEQTATECYCYLTLKDAHIVPIVAISSEGFILEKIEGSDLFDLINSSTYLSPQTIKSYCLMLANLLERMHRENVVYADLKPENVLISIEDNKIYLCDFGLAALAQHDFMKCQGSIQYVAPEILWQRLMEQQLQEPKQKISTQIDSWAFGILLYAMIFKELPEFSKQSLADQIISRYMWLCPDEIFSDDDIDFTTNKATRDPQGHFQNLIKKCLDGNPTRRITMQAIRETLESIPY